MNRIWVAGLTCATMTFTFMGLSNLIKAGPWQWHMIGLNVLVTAGMMVVFLLTGRHKILSRVATLAAGLLIWLWYVTGIGSGSFLPTPSALSTLVTNLGDAIAALPNYGRPAPDLFVPLGVMGLGPMCVAAFFLAVNLRSPLSAGIPALGCWIVFLSGGPTRGVGWAVASAASYLMLVGISDRKGRPGRFSSLAIPVVALSAVLGMVASYVLPLTPTWGRSEDLLDFWNGTYTDNTGLNVDGPIQVADSLRNQSSVLLFHTQGESSEPLKMGTLDQFTGTSWVLSSRGRIRPYQQGTMVWYQWGGPNDSPGDGWSAGPDVSVRIDQLSGLVVPAGDGPRSITDVDGMALSYDPWSDAFRSRSNVIDEGDSYVTHTMVLDRAALRRIGVDDRTSVLDPAVVPHADEIVQLTNEVIGGATSQDDILSAIEAYLRGPDFTYTLTPAWESHGDPVWDFLTSKQGYCVHYATAMAVMAMSVGIPMQVSVGYLPGAPEEDDWRGVTGARAHMWPEAYFAGVGWVRYEPTPAIQTGDVGAALPGDVPIEEPTESAEPAQGETQLVLPAATAAPTTGPSAAQGRTIDWALIGEIGGGVAGALVVALAGWLVWISLYSPERAWRSILRAGMKKGLLTPAMSVRKVVSILAGRVPSCAPDLHCLGTCLEVSRYAPPDAKPEPISGRRLWKLKRSVVKQLRTY